MHINSPAGCFFVEINNKSIMKLIDYIKDTRGELKHVSWPTRRQATVFTILVIAISLFTAAFLGFFDFIFTFLLETFIL